MINTYLPQVNFGNLTETASPSQFKVDVLSHCVTLPILFCPRFLSRMVLVKGKCHRKFREITKPAPYLSGSFGENRDVFPIGKIPEKKEESLRFLGFFS